MVRVRGRVGGDTPIRSRLTFVVGQSDLMMHYDITVNDDCEIRLR